MGDFHIRLTGILAERGISAYKMAADLQVISEAMIGKWKNGQSLPSFENVVLLSKYLGVACDFLMTGKEPELPLNDQQLLTAYRAADEGTRRAVDKLLDIP